MTHKHIFTIFLLVILSLSVEMCSRSPIHGTVVCFGDSITHGAHVHGHSWVYFSNQKHPNIDFINEGQNGRRTADKKQILPVLKQYPNANYFLIFLGVNDLKDGTPAMTDSCVQNMQWMINKVKRATSAKIVILAPTEINLKTMVAYNVKKKYNRNTKKSLVLLKSKYKKLAKRDSVGFISLLHAVSPQNYVDGLHPTTAGQKQIARAVWKGLNKLYN